MHYNTVILGAGAAGMMCAAHSGGSVLLVDHARAPGEKIRISGGGRCNFTNMHCSPGAFISRNPHFAKSALAKYTQWDFIALVDAHAIAWHEKTLGQLFCDTSAKLIIAMLRDLMQNAGVELRLQSTVEQIEKTDSGYSMSLITPQGATTVTANQLVIASGGKSIPKMGATAAATSFDEAILFTHRGLSGPAILQASSYWMPGTAISINLLSGDDVFARLRDQRQTSGRRNLTTELAHHLPTRLVDHLAADMDLAGNLADWSDRRLQTLCNALSNWTMTPSGTEGYRTAEVTLGGIDTDALSSKTMQSKTVRGLYFIGEALDVTGWLGGYNFQWAWSSAMAAARDIARKA